MQLVIIHGTLYAPLILSDYVLSLRMIAPSPILLAIHFPSLPLYINHLFIDVSIMKPFLILNPSKLTRLHLSN